ncbi:hypothetical protein ACYSUW_14525 [Pseudomonas frederiksbergensis]
MNWLDYINHWDYSLGPVLNWFLDIAEFHIQRAGWSAYIAIAAFIIGIGLSFPATRTITSHVVTGTVKMFFTIIQAVFVLLIVQFVGYLAKVLMAQFHRTRRWIADIIRRNWPAA